MTSITPSNFLICKKCGRKFVCIYTKTGKKKEGFICGMSAEGRKFTLEKNECYCQECNEACETQFVRTRNPSSVKYDLNKDA